MCLTSSEGSLSGGVESSVDKREEVASVPQDCKFRTWSSERAFPTVPDALAIPSLYSKQQN